MTEITQRIKTKSYASFQVHKSGTEDDMYYDGYYISREGRAVQIWASNRHEHCTFEFIFNNHSFERTYKRVLTMHAMQLLSAKLIKDVLKGNFKHCGNYGK